MLRDSGISDAAIYRRITILAVQFLHSIFSATRYTEITMKTLLLIAAFLMPLPALADVESYVEVGGKEIVLAGQCRCDGIHWGKCAIADRSMVASDDEMVMCWREEGDKIIFTNESMTIERRLKDVKIRVFDDPSRSPVSEPSSDQPPA